MSIVQVIAANNNVQELQQLCKQFRNKEFRKALKLRQQWDAEDLAEIIAENEQLPCKPVCTTSYGEGESDDEDTDWRERYESTREAPYGCLTEDDMVRAIREGDIDTIDENPVLANITLGNMLKEDPELEEQLDNLIRNHKGEDIPDWDTVAEWQETAAFAPTDDDIDDWGRYIGDDSMIKEFRAGEAAEDNLSYWEDLPETDLPVDALVMIQEQRSHSPKRQSFAEAKAQKRLFLSMF